MGGPALVVLANTLGRLPMGMLHRLSHALSVVLRTVVGYRQEVVRANLARCFPDLDDAERHAIERRFYRHLTDQVVEGVKAFRLTRSEVVRRCRVLNPECLTPYADAGRSVLMVFGHTHNWEWPALAGPDQIPHRLMAVYKPVKDAGIDAQIVANRERFGARLVAMRAVPRFYAGHPDEPYAAAFLADQNPTNPRHAHWPLFFGHRTAFLAGPARIARKYDLPVVYLDVRRVRRGHYALFLEDLVPEPTQVEEETITQRFARRLEVAIRSEPHAWLWSHKRWKHDPERWIDG